MKKSMKQTTIKEDVGKLLLDLGKLIFGAIFLGGILRGEVPQLLLVVSGFSVALIFFTVGILFTTKKKNNEDITIFTEKENR